jgi:lipid II:glycine glycyltransferase (peptidoglycan interpeptide bridge formation enzyme)
MTARFATEKEIQAWNSHIANEPGGGNILQGKEFIDQKSSAGWAPRFIFVNDHAVSMMEKSLPFLGKIWYCPKGPTTTSHKDLQKIVSVLAVFAKKQGVFSIKIEPELPHDTKMNNLGLIKTKPIQYNYATVLINLSPSLDEIMKALPQKGRHAIRRAERDGVTVKKVAATDKNCTSMYKLFQETAQDANFVIRPVSYYKEFYRRYEKNGTGQLFFAYVDNKIVAGAFAMTLSEKSMYKDGASSRKRTAYGASHLLQWHVIQWAKEHGSKEHDLAGTPPIAEIRNPDHPFYGLGRFKTSFNKTVTEYVGAYDIPVRPLKANLWHRYIEKIVRRVYFRRHHESFY